MKLWKIRNPAGKFSTGGTRPKFTDKGKTWEYRHHVLSHIRSIDDDVHRRGNTSSDRSNLKPPENTYAGCEVVEYELVEAGSSPVQEWIDEVRDERIRKYGKP